MNRVAGLETEYGCLSGEHAGTGTVVSRVRNWIFEQCRFGLPDVHQRDWDEPVGNGGFLFNGGRAYVDMGHMEYCTPECRHLRDLVLHDRVGDVMVTLALKELGLQRESGFVRNSIDHFTGATFGCHENYLVRRSAPLNEENVLSLLAFLTLRVLYCGAGRVGAAPEVEMGRLEKGEPAIDFQISQRADFIHNDFFEWVQFNRAIINTRDEPLADRSRYRRLHLLHGDANVLPSALALKMGTTALVLDLLEIHKLPKVFLLDAVATLRSLSYNTTGPWRCLLAGGEEGDVLELLDGYRQACVEEFAGRDEETDSILALWKETMEGLAGDHAALVGRVDWITKKYLLSEFVEEEGLEWSDPWVKAQDLEYHHADADRSLGLAMAATPDWLKIEDDIDTSLLNPPKDSRAALRGRLLKAISTLNRPYLVDWELVDLKGYQHLLMKDPFASDTEEAESWMKAISGLPPFEEDR